MCLYRNSVLVTVVKRVALHKTDDTEVWDLSRDGAVEFEFEYFLNAVSNTN